MAPRHGDLERSLLLALGIVLSLALLDRCEYVHAEDDTARTLAAMCVGEAGWHLDECTAIAEVVRARGGGVIRGEVMRAYSAALKRPEGRPWLLGLDGGAEPPGWPGRLRWARWEPHWKRMLGHARRLVAGEVPSVCAETPLHWGGPMDSWRAHRAGWTEVDCGATRNRFWRL